MAKTVHAENEAVNADSFLDIVASIVSIMIIMVLMTGLKIKHSPVDLPADDSGAAEQMAVAELAKDVSTQQTLRGDVLKLAGEIESIQQQTAVRGHERDLLALAVQTLEQKINGGREQAQGQSRQDAERGIRVASARAAADDLRRRRAAIEGAPAPAVQVESYPTPISRSVDGREIHFQLHKGRLTYIPLDRLLPRFESDAERKLHKLRDDPEMTETVGPEGGFRLRYTLERHEVTLDENRQTGRSGAYVRLKRWTLIPVADDLGESVAEALAEGSQFRQATAERRNRDATVTLWTYPDSFDAFRQLKKELYRQGYRVAARPLPEGTPISGSPEGSKSASQ